MTEAPGNNKHFVGKLALGTVQFGLPYGISNTSGKVAATEVAEILKFASKKGITLLDTAAAYGDSEEVLGEKINTESFDFRLVSKMQNVKPDQVEGALQQSLLRLQTSALYGYLVHDFEWFRENPVIWESLLRLKEQGLVQKIGFSLYSPEQAEWLLQQGFIPDLVQVPYNVFDQRFSNIIPELKAVGAEVHLRSIFLQGLFFLSPEKLRPHFAPYKEKLEALQWLFSQNELPVSAGLVCFAWLCEGADKLVLGVESLQNLKANLAAAQWLNKTKELYPELQQFAQSCPEILVPANWK